MTISFSRTFYVTFFVLFPLVVFAQLNADAVIDQGFKNTLLLHKELVSIPNLPENEALMLKNINWVAQQYNTLDFKTTLLPSSTLPILLAEKIYDPNYETVLFYFHIDGQPVNPAVWDQADPFVPVLKEKDADGVWQALDWNQLDGVINDAMVCAGHPESPGPFSEFQHKNNFRPPRGIRVRCFIIYHR